MTIKDTYITFLNLVNRNATNNNVNVDKSRFIQLLRSAELGYYDLVLRGSSNDALRQVQHLLVPKKSIALTSKKDTFDLYKLPVDYFELSNLQVSATSDSCTDYLKSKEVKSENIEEIINDSFQKPSFEYRETIYHLADNHNIAIYKDNFSIKDVNLTYYRLPRQVSIDGYIMTDGTLSSVDVDPEWDDKTLYKILLYMSKNFSASNEDTAKYQIDKDSLSERLR